MECELPVNAITHLLCSLCNDNLIWSPMLYIDSDIVEENGQYFRLDKLECANCGNMDCIPARISPPSVGIGLPDKYTHLPVILLL